MKPAIQRAIAPAVLAAGLATAPALAADVTVGMLVPTSGVYAALGNEIADGFRLALEDAGVADRVEIVTEDSEAVPQVGLAKARKLVFEDEADVLAGIVSSGVLAAVRDFVDQSQVPLIVANAGDDNATGPNCTPYIVRVSFSNGQVNRPMGQWLFDQGVRRVATLAPDYAAGHQMIEAFKTGFTEAGGEIVSEEFTPFRNTQDFGPYLTKAQSANPDAVFVFYAGGEAIAFVKQYDAFGLKADVPLYASGFLTSPLYVNAQGPAAEGVVTSLHYIPTLETPENQAFVDKFQERTGRVPSEYAVQGYDAGFLLAEAIKAGATDRESIAAALPKVSYTGPRGPLTIDPETNNIVQNIYIYETVNEGGQLTQKLIDTVENVRDPVNGCTL